MRKIDYSRLAQQIRQEWARLGIEREQTSDPDTLRTLDRARESLRAVVWGFARRANVDRASFIEACGIT